MENYEAKFLCSYGGEIQTRAHDDKLSYVGGDNKILYVDRSITFPAMLAEVSALFDATGDFSFKYQLPGDDLNYLISVTSDNDLHNMMLEYDHLYCASPKTARMRLFLFPNNHLDSDPAPAQPDPDKPDSKVDDGAVVLSPPATVRFHDPPPEPVATPPAYQPRAVVKASHRVFLSFRGEDTRTNFLSDLVRALSREQIETYIGYSLLEGDKISASIFRAIENSCVSVVVFSQNFASSNWCLEELVKIMECRKEHGRDVIPVFYNVDPSHVRKQVGSYNKAFKKHLQNLMPDMKKVQKWREALTQAADLAGWDSRSYRDDDEVIQKIVKDVSQKLNYHYSPNDIKSPDGISEKIEYLDSLLREDATIKIGIWGMGGIGKTTIARRIFEKYSDQYEGSCFLGNVRERSGKYGQGLHHLLYQLYSELLQEKICPESTAKLTYVKHRLRKQRNFVVLDDVSSPEQLEYLVGELQCQGSGSKIIITARDKCVLEKRVEKMYKMEVLDFQKSLKLFSLNAFNKDYPQMGYDELSQKAVVYCRGVPLALKVLGSFLHSKSETEWDSAMQKLEKIPNAATQNVLRLVYDGLDDQEKHMFLGIACFFKGDPKEHIVNILESCRSDAAICMRSLLDKALITISDNSVWMHDLLQEMGREIVHEESIENRRYLWDFDDIYDVLENNKGTQSIEGIELDSSQSRENLCFSVDTFKKMSRLKFLKLYIPPEKHGRSCILKTLSDELRFLEWYAYPLQSLPSKFCPEKLVTLRIPNSQVKRLWNGVQNLVNLKEVNLTECSELVELPDMSKANNLESLHLSNCRSLRHVHPSILSLGKLDFLNLVNCAKLETLESKIHSRSLKHLHLDGCSSLMKFALSSAEIEYLDLSQTRIKVLHSSIARFNKVKEISLHGLRLENLPKGLSCLKSLEKLSLSGCGPVVSKKKLHVIFDGLQSLQNLSLENCDHLCELPVNLSSLSSLRKLLLDGSHVGTLPGSIKHLPNLKTLSLRGCRWLQYLPELPPSIRHLKALNCTELQTVAFSLITSGLQEKKRINISLQNCVNLDVEKCIYSFLQHVRELAYGCELRRRKRRGREKGVVWRSDLFKICYPGCRVPEWFTYRAMGASITFEVASPSNYHFSSLLCVVLSSQSLDFELDIKCRCYLEDGNLHKYSFGISFLNRIPMKGNSDHVYMTYNYGGIFDLMKLDRLNNRIASSRYNPKITFEFFVSRGVIGWNQDDNLLIKECGVYPLNAPDDRIEQMELELGMKNRRHWDARVGEH